LKHGAKKIPPQPPTPCFVGSGPLYKVGEDALRAERDLFSFVSGEGRNVGFMMNNKIVQSERSEQISHFAKGERLAC